MGKKYVLFNLITFVTLALSLNICSAGEGSTAVEESVGVTSVPALIQPDQHLGVEWIPNGFSISIGKAQRICYFKDSVPLHCAGISSGKRGFRSITGNFQVQSKQAMHYSSKYKDGSGRPAKMPWSMHFYGGYFIHEGKLPGYPASHGCIRVAKGDSKKFFDLGQVGDPVLVTM